MDLGHTTITGGRRPQQHSCRTEDPNARRSVATQTKAAPSPPSARGADVGSTPLVDRRWLQPFADRSSHDYMWRRILCCATLGLFSFSACNQLDAGTQQRVGWYTCRQPGRRPGLGGALPAGTKLTAKRPRAFSTAPPHCLRTIATHAPRRAGQRDASKPAAPRSGQ